MPVHLDKHKLTYFSVPKVACSSLKRFFFQIENGFEFRPFRMNGERYGIHRFAPCIPLNKVDTGKSQGHIKIAVVRDPWRRILSCYADKVVGSKVLHGKEFTPEQKRLGLTPEPSIDNFIDLLPHYREASWVIRHHSAPLSHFLGSDPAFFDRIFSIKNLSEFTSYVADYVGEVPVLQHTNKRPADSVVLSSEEETRNRNKIDKAYSEDLELYERYM